MVAIASYFISSDALDRRTVLPALAVSGPKPSNIGGGRVIAAIGATA
jgi:hypothetical protein